MQLAETLGFILNSRSGKFLGLTPDEKSALHECLTWLRQPGNNPQCFYGAELEGLADCSPIWNRQRALRSGIWLSGRACKEQNDFDPELVPQDGALGLLEARLPHQVPPIQFECQPAKKRTTWPVDR